MSLFTQYTGTVQNGKGLGKSFGFPTANISLHAPTLENATYMYSCVVQDKLYRGLGPYFPEKYILEVHLLDFTGDLYQQSIDLIPLRKLRENQKFSNTDTLIAQIQQDKAQAKKTHVTVLTFGTFDWFHPGHRAYLSHAKRYGTQLVTIIARDTTVTTVKGNTPDHNENYRLQKVREAGIADRVVLGDTDNHYDCLDTYQPDVVCLGYDQRSFDTGINKYCKEKNIPTPHIVRLPAFEPDKRKSSLVKTLSKKSA